jgi:menaquinone-dependent protoporphyrinogen oxidase
MKILVTCAGSTGPAMQVAERIAAVLTSLGEMVTVLPMNGVESLKGYNAVVAGSMEHAGHWLPEALDFIRRYQGVFWAKPLAIFTVCPSLGSEKGAESRMVVMQYTAPVRSMTHPVSEGFFSDEIAHSRATHPGERSRFKLSILLGILKETDQRNRAEIETWAAKLQEKLSQTASHKVKGAESNAQG